MYNSLSHPGRPILLCLGDGELPGGGLGAGCCSHPVSFSTSNKTPLAQRCLEAKRNYHQNLLSSMTCVVSVPLSGKKSTLILKKSFP